MTQKTFIGTKIVIANPMTRAAYNAYRGWPLPDDENGEDEGYLVEYTDGGAANHTAHKGYISWSPAAVFEKAYRPTGGLTFGQALELIKTGRRVARSGWNGKGMFLFLNKGVFDGAMLGFDAGEQPSAAHPSTIDGCRLGLFDAGGKGIVTRLPNIHIRSASGSTVPGWLASSTDMLAEDWTVLPDED